MKKFKLYKLLALVLVVGVIATTFACSQGTHEHKFSNEWSSDAQSHWKVCIEKCEEISEKADHTYDGGVVTTPSTEAASGVMTYTCTVCGYKKEETIDKLHEHEFATDWSSNEFYHWHDAACGHDFAVSKTEHDFKNGVCSVCGATQVYDGTTLTVMSFNLGTNGVQNQYNKANLQNKVKTELPDLLGTQEENSLWTAALKEVLAPLGYKNVIQYRDGVYDSTLGNEGEGIWYNAKRFTLNDWGYFWISDTPEKSSIWDMYGAEYKRITTWAELTDKASGKSFVYFNTHIGYESSELWLRSAELLLDRMHAHYEKGLPCIITGDFNFQTVDEGAQAAYAKFTSVLKNPHYEAVTKNYEVGKENTFSGYGKYQGDSVHVKPIDYMLYTPDFVANTYSILREELPNGAIGGDDSRQYFCSDHFAIKTVFTFSEDWGKHVCWHSCETCGKCLDANCSLCTEKCQGNHS